ncbi:MAG: helix-turn-helix domain-containing protein [Synergistaceae bacterium]|nr:helix-turn-helix domain-containing protein [Synergistaceae bacterium]
MSEISEETGRRIHDFRKRRSMTLQEMAGLIHKSKSTVSKYESGEIAIDI